MIKKIGYIKKILAMGAIASFVIFSTTALAAVSVTCSVSTSLLKKSATAEGYSCAAVGCIIYDSSGSSLASGENGVHSTNAYRTQTVSYTGLKSADKAWGYAIDTAGNSASTYTYY